MVTHWCVPISGSFRFNSIVVWILWRLKWTKSISWRLWFIDTPRGAKWQLDREDEKSASKSKQTWSCLGKKSCKINFSWCLCHTGHRNELSRTAKPVLSHVRQSLKTPMFTSRHQLTLEISKINFARRVYFYVKFIQFQQNIRTPCHLFYRAAILLQANGCRFWTESWWYSVTPDRDCRTGYIM